MKSRAAVLADRLNKLNREICAEEMALAEEEERISAEHSRRLAQLEDDKRHALKVSEAEMEKKSSGSHARVKQALSEHDKNHQAIEQKVKDLMKSKARDQSEMESSLAEKIEALEYKKGEFQHIREFIPRKYLKKYACSKLEEQLTEIDALESLLNKVLDDTLWSTVKGVIGVDGYYSRKSMACDLCYKIDCSLAYLDSQIQLAQKEQAQELSRLESEIEKRIKALHDEDAASSRAAQAAKDNEIEFRKDQLSLKDDETARIESEYRQACSNENREYEQKVKEVDQASISIKAKFEEALSHLNIPSFLQSEYEKITLLGGTRNSWDVFDAFPASIPPAFPLGFIGYHIDATGDKRSVLEARLKSCLSPKALSGFAYDTAETPSMYWTVYSSSNPAHIAGFRFIISSRAKLLPFGMLRVLFCDPKMKGMNLGWLKDWANDSRGRVVFSDVATTSSEIEACLKRENENLGEIGMAIPPYNNVAEFNASNPDTPIPLTMIIVNDVDDEFLSQYSIETLRAIAVNGKKFGYSILVTSHSLDEIEEDSRKRTLSKLEKEFEHIEETADGSYILSNGNDFAFFDDDFITRDFIRSFANKYHEVQAERESSVIETDIRLFITPEGKSSSGRKHIIEADGMMEGISVPYAVNAKGEVINFHIGRQPDYHVLATGSIGSGKSNLFHVLINSIAANYYPNEIELWLMEFKGVDFSAYRNTRLPHITMIGLSEDADFRHSLFEKIELEFKIKRTALLDAAHVKRIDEYNALSEKPAYCSQYPEGCPEYLPHVVLIIDELGVISKQFSADEARKFSEMLALYRSHGLYVLMANQTVDTKKPLIEEFENVRGRIGLPNQDDSEFRKLFPNDFLSSGMPPAYNLKRGQAVQYSEGKYDLVQIPYIDPETIASVSRAAISEFGQGAMTIVEQNDPRPVYDPDEIERLVSKQPLANDIAQCFVGQAVSLVNTHKPIGLKRDFFQNILIIGSNEDLKYSTSVGFGLSILEQEGHVLVVSHKKSPMHDAYKAFCKSMNCEFAETVEATYKLIEALSERAETISPALLIIDSGSSLFDELELEIETIKQDKAHKKVSTKPASLTVVGVDNDLASDEETQARLKFAEFAAFRNQLRKAHNTNGDNQSMQHSELTLEEIKECLHKIIKRGSLDGLHCCWTDTTEPEFASKALFGFDWGSRKTSQVFGHRITTALAHQDASIARNLGFGEQPLDMSLSNQEKIVVYSDETGNVCKYKPYAMPWLSKEGVC